MRRSEGLRSAAPPASFRMTARCAACHEHFTVSGSVAGSVRKGVTKVPYAYVFRCPCGVDVRTDIPGDADRSTVVVKMDRGR